MTTAGKPMVAVARVAFTRARAFVEPADGTVWRAKGVRVVALLRHARITSTESAGRPSACEAGGGDEAPHLPADDADELVACGSGLFQKWIKVLLHHS
ncbi:hypothetical protein [Streptomyces sp. enrichment culture]|uniref:hypothetical protein n=1 Tax=Streptomyces sp. enrichment culture TaxID=1795815 RepID=UPI003F54D892